MIALDLGRAQRQSLPMTLEILGETLDMAMALGLGRAQRPS